MVTSVALLGAGGKVGQRIVDQIEGDPTYHLRCVEPAQEGREALASRGIESLPRGAALDGADVVILAVPDDVIGDVSKDVVPAVDAGTVLLLLDPAAAYAGVVPERADIGVVITHPCHPPLFDPERPPAYADDWFGGTGRAAQDIVCALHAGSDAAYQLGEGVARDIFAPVRDVYRLTTEQMALLEPTLAETLSQTLLETIHEGMAEVEALGVPAEAAEAFLLGHLRIQMAVIFGRTDFPFSDAAQQMSTAARDDLLEEDWKDVLTREYTRESVRQIADPD